MKHFDVFNGDADGICALHQLRLARPLRSSLVTGVKRDVRLPGRVPIRSGIPVTVLDISLDVNRRKVQASWPDRSVCKRHPQRSGRANMRLDAASIYHKARCHRTSLKSLTRPEKSHGRRTG